MPKVEISSMPSTKKSKSTASDTKRNKTASASAKRSGGSAGNAKNGAKSTNKSGISASAPAKEHAVFHQIMPVVTALAALYIFICYVFSSATGAVGVWLRGFFYGLFSYGAFALPIVMIIRALFWKNDVKGECLGARFAFSLSFVAGISALAGVFGKQFDAFSIPNFYTMGKTLDGGGLVGGIISWALMHSVGLAGTLIIIFALVFVCGLFMLGITPYMIWVRLAYTLKHHRENIKEREAEYVREAEETEANRPVLTKRQRPQTPPPAAYEKPKKAIDVPLPEAPEDTEEEADTAADAASAAQPIDTEVWDEIRNQPPEEPDEAEIYDAQKPETVAPERDARHTDKAGHEIDLDYIFSEDDDRRLPDNYDAASDEDSAELEIGREEIGTVELPDGGVLAHSDTYRFPPLSLLHKDTTVKATDVSDEQKATAEKLVETLKSYKINTRLVSISRGPSITRYELSPEVGTKVNAITNRIDDISLHLATTGVRIVAPIPGMEAVGVEVPNKKVSLVYIRELLENEEFKKNPSKLFVALGMDVTGKPIYMDIARMPHLLIAGATGMGKSVCINSTIISILYKATPDEVKLILIDPKQVEFTMYDGIPHLLVPVVTDPKKAAGTLHWAVTEMERRYELINGASVRNIQAYNEKMKDEPDREYMPQIVIIIDELADLMLTASNDVDESIRRLSAKARAAGIHLILGTQRPSVDVITGTIKSNIPYRIAFTTTSYVDSRTILDIGGAEKLIGKGDMLYAATGKAPIRVQGSFVSDEEVGDITGFIKKESGGANYNTKVVESIEKEAELCGKKATSLGDGEIENNSGDPLLKPAIEIAVDSGKISTSLLQRKLSIGFGRAAKLIDIMEERGIVSPQDGQKPRTTLWTKQQYMESVLKNED